MPWAPGLHRGLHRTLHRAPEAHAAGELVGDTLGDQRRVELGLLDLLDVEVDLRVAGDLQQTRAQAVRLRATATDDDARARGVDVDAQTVARALDLDAADHRSLQLLLQVVTDLPVLDELVRVLLVLGEPPRLPVGGDSEAKPVRVDLLTHYLLASGSEPSSLSSAPASDSGVSASSAAASVASSVSAAVSAASSISGASASASSSGTSASPISASTCPRGRARGHDRDRAPRSRPRCSRRPGAGG